MLPSKDRILQKLIDINLDSYKNYLKKFSIYNKKIYCKIIEKEINF